MSHVSIKFLSVGISEMPCVALHNSISYRITEGMCLAFRGNGVLLSRVFQYLTVSISYSFVNLATSVTVLCFAYARTPSQLNKCYFTEQKILMSKHSYFAWYNRHTNCPLVVSLAGRNMSFLSEHRPKNRPSHGCHNSNFTFIELCRFSRIYYAMWITYILEIRWSVFQY